MCTPDSAVDMCVCCCCDCMQLVEAERRLLSVCVSLLMSASATVGREYRQLATRKKHLPELSLVITDMDRWGGGMAGIA